MVWGARAGFSLANLSGSLSHSFGQAVARLRVIKLQLQKLGPGFELLGGGSIPFEE
ncbi:MAG TPA: hypothetical protein VMU43_07820 [Candidatus Acidoferrum sp.]|nr:hypothetical protein [Candidatus Acidoferrum sp.]